MTQVCTDHSGYTPLMGNDGTTYFPPVVNWYYGHVDSANGSRITPEEILFLRDGSLMGYDNYSCCKIADGFPPALEGFGHGLATYRYIFKDLTFYLPRRAAFKNMFSCGVQAAPDDEKTSRGDQALAAQAPIELVWDGVELNGRQILPSQHIYPIYCPMEFVFEKKYYNAKKGKPPPLTKLSLKMHNFLSHNFASYSEVEAPDGGDFDALSYPHTDAIWFFVKNRINTNTTVEITNSTFKDMDFAALRLSFFTNTTIIDTHFRNCSGRGFGNFACMYLEGNDVSTLLTNSKNFDAYQYFLDSPSSVFVSNCTGVNTWDLIYIYDGKQSTPGFVTMYVFNGFPNTTDFCFLYSSSSGLAAGMRVSNTKNTTYSMQCSRTSAKVDTSTPDLLRYLRAMCEANKLENVNGLLHDLMDGVSTTDVHGETKFCDSMPPEFLCCPIVDPDQCYVTSDPALLLPGNKFLGQFIFTTINDAIVNCNASRRVITVIGDADPFQTGAQGPVTYFQVINAIVPLASVGGVTGNMLIQATPGVTIVGAGHWIDTQNQIVRIEGFTFQHSGVIGLPVWDYTMVSPCGIRFDGNSFDTIYNELLLDVNLAGCSDFKSTSNRYIGRVTGSPNDPTRGVRVRGTCVEQGITFSGDKFRDLLGYGLDLRQVNQYRVHNVDLRNVGGQDSLTRIPYSILVSDCPVGPVPVRRVEFSRVRVRTTQTTNALVGYMAACWIEYWNRGLKPYQIYNNDCRRMQFGVRFENVSPLPVNKGPLRNLARAKLNIDSKGLNNIGPNSMRFDLVIGPPSNDLNLVAFPDDPANKPLWCTDACPIDLTYVLYIAAAILALLVGIATILCCFTAGCTPAKYRRKYREPPIMPGQNDELRREREQIKADNESGSYGGTLRMPRQVLVYGHTGSEVTQPLLGVEQQDDVI